MKLSYKILIYLLIIFALIISGVVFVYFKSFERKDFQLGVDFNVEHAKYLGLDWQQSYLAILDDLKVKNIRLSAPWNYVEPVEGKFDFTNLDWQVEEAQKRNVSVILVLGRRTPRWPECHDPLWIADMSKQSVIDRQLFMMKKIIDRYKNYDNIKMWQVENEPLLNVFGVCPPGDYNLLQQEVAMVKTFDTRPVLVTDSGELSYWIQAANAGDYFGTTLYRVTYNSSWGYLYYSMPPIFYRAKAWLAGKSPDKVIVSELQGEPWGDRGLAEMPLADQLLSMNAARLANHINYAKRTGFSAAYVWGAEWWYWLKEKNNNSDLWDTAKMFFD